MNHIETHRIPQVINPPSVSMESSPQGSGTRVSVIVPNWNGLRFIGMCLDSLKRSDLRRF